MSILPVSNIINVTITNTPSGLTERNVNSLALFTTEQPNNLDVYGIYISAAQVAADYGSNSDTAAMANAIFSQTPNLMTGDGRLVIIPMVAAVSATSANFSTTNISANLAALLAVNNGDLRVTVDGVINNLTMLDFTNCDDFSDIAQIIQARLLDCIVEPIANTGLKFTSKKVGLTGSTIALAAIGGGTGTNLAAAGMLNTAGGATVAGTNASGETIQSAMTRTAGAVGYVPAITNLEMEDAVITALASYIQARDNMFVHHFRSSADLDGVIKTISDAGETKFRSVLYTQPSPNLMKSAYAGRAFSVNFDGSFTSQTMNLKALVTITPDLGISQTLYEKAKTNGADLYVSYDGVASVLSSGGNDFFDNPYSDLALKFALETAGFNFLRQTNTKVPQTETGMNGLKSAYANVLEAFIRNGCVAAGSWTSSETFGDPEIFKNNILTRGYYIYSLPITLQSAPDREARKAPLCQIAVKRAGAIHTSNVIVLVND